jgi:hypothetical protein
LEGSPEAARSARSESGLHIPIAESTIAQFPEGFEQRLMRVTPELQHLELWVPDGHRQNAVPECERTAADNHDGRTSVQGTVDLDKESFELCGFVAFQFNAHFWKISRMRI